MLIYYCIIRQFVSFIITSLRSNGLAWALYLLKHPGLKYFKREIYSCLRVLKKGHVDRQTVTNCILYDLELNDRETPYGDVLRNKINVICNEYPWRFGLSGDCLQKSFTSPKFSKKSYNKAMKFG